MWEAVSCRDLSSFTGLGTSGCCLRLAGSHQVARIYGNCRGCLTESNPRRCESEKCEPLCIGCSAWPGAPL